VQTADDIGDDYTTAAGADVSFSGRQLTVRDGQLVAMEDRFLGDAPGPTEHRAPFPKPPRRGG